jgi:hypothetical protein
MSGWSNPDEPWLARIRDGDFSALPEPFTYAHTSSFSHLINGYRVSDDLGWPMLRAWANERGAEAACTGIWRGTALELWCVLFYERRRYRHAGEGDPIRRDLELLDQLCATLREKLQTLSTDEHALILHFIAVARRPLTLPY